MIKKNNDKYLLARKKKKNLSSVFSRSDGPQSKSKSTPQPPNTQTLPEN